MTLPAVTWSRQDVTNIKGLVERLLRGYGKPTSGEAGTQLVDDYLAQLAGLPPAWCVRGVQSCIGDSGRFAVHPPGDVRARVLSLAPRGGVIATDQPRQAPNEPVPPEAEE